MNDGEGLISVVIKLTPDGHNLTSPKSNIGAILTL